MFDEEAFPDGRSLKFLTDRELHAPDIVDRICERWSGHKWSSDEMTAWSRWQWKEVVR